MQRSIKFWENWYRAIKWMPEKKQGAFAMKLLAYAFDGEEPEIEPSEGAAWELIRVAIDEASESAKNGSAGGRPKGTKNNPSKNPSGDNPKTPLSEIQKPPLDNPENPLSENAKTPFSDSEKPPSANNKNPSFHEYESEYESERERESEYMNSGVKPHERAPSGAGGKPKRGFSPPSLEEVKAYVSEKGLSVDPEAFLDHFTSNGWKVGGRAPMKDWRAAARNWSRRETPKSEVMDDELLSYASF